MVKNDKYQLVTTVTGNPKRGYDIIIKQSEKDKESLVEIDERTFKKIVTKTFVSLIEEYADQHPEMESRVDFYDEIYEDLANRLNDSYDRYISRETARWAKDHYPKATVMSMSLEDLDKFISSLDEGGGGEDE